MSTIWFTSDHHANHANMLKYDNANKALLEKTGGKIPRPFATIEKHDEALIQRWNDKVQPGDKVYHLGDFCFHKNVDAAREWVSRLNGRIYLLYGNHRSVDKNLVQDGLVNLNSFALGRDYCFDKKYGKESKITLLPAEYELKIPDADGYDGNQLIVLSHYAHRVWNRSHHGSWLLYGHSHGSLPDDPNSKSFDVGCMLFDLAPISYEQVKQIMSTKAFLPVDHHGED